MAGDWIKIEKATARKPEVLQIAMRMGIHPDQAFGLCIRFWMWCDDNMTDGTAPINCPILDALIGASGFAQSLLEVGWLKDRKNALEVPNFERHLSHSAKLRCLATERKRNSRSAKKAVTSVTEMSQKTVTNVTKKRDQRREEKRRDEINPDITPRACEDFDEAKPGQPNPNLGDRLTFLTGPSAACKRFVATYPRKTSPATAWRVWDALIVTICSERGMTDAAVEEWLIERAAAYASSPAGMPPPPGQDDFRPSPAKWLEQGKYDEPQSEWSRPNGNGAGNASRRTGQTARDRATDTGEDLDALFDAIVSAKSASGVE